MAKLTSPVLKKSDQEGVAKSRLNNSNSDHQFSASSITLTNKNDLKLSQMSDEKNCIRKGASPAPQTPPKQVRHIRFDLDETLTPSPKEFRRLGSQRRTLRAVRCMSTVVTEKEKAWLLKNETVRSNDRLNSPKPPPGIVQSMCRFYNNNFGKSR